MRNKIDYLGFLFADLSQYVKRLAAGCPGFVRRMMQRLFDENLSYLLQIVYIIHVDFSVNKNYVIVNVCWPVFGLIRKPALFGDSLLYNLGCKIVYPSHTS